MIAVRTVTPDDARAPNDRAFVEDLGRRCAMASVSTLRRAPEKAVSGAYDRLVEIVDGQSHVTFIAQEGEHRVGFLLMLDDLPDEVTALPQAFIAYMAVEPEFRGRGAGRALLAAAEAEARQRRLPHLTLMVTEENEAARRLYERDGFQTERRLLCKAL